jgi:DNA-3-methyladenine glycosylase
MARNRGLILNARPHELTAGPSRLCQALGLARQSHNGLDLLDPASPLQLWESDLAVDRILITSRIGIRRAAELPLRFAVADNPCLSGPKNLLGRYVALSSL